jgi:hypothetical protein
LLAIGGGREGDLRPLGLLGLFLLLKVGEQFHLHLGHLADLLLTLRRDRLLGDRLLAGGAGLAVNQEERAAGQRGHQEEDDEDGAGNGGFA